MFMRGDYGKVRDPPFLMLECVTQTRIPTERCRTPQQIYKQRETEKKRQYSSRVMEIEHGTFTPLVCTTTGGMAEECRRYHCPLAELISIKKGEPYAATISWIRT